MYSKDSVAESILTPELYFLISKFLAAGPLKETAKVLIDELERKKVLPKRLDWLGHEHEQSFSELEKQYSHISPNHLLEICCRIGPILDKDLPPSVPGILSLLGSGRQSLLRTHATVYHSRSLLDYCTRIHGVSLPDSSITKPIHNIHNVLFGREYGGPIYRKLLVPTCLYVKTKLLRRTVGHLSSVYCVLFDRTGRYIVTGADDLLVKIWSSMDGRLLATLRGATAEITDIAINLDNTMLAAGSIDRILRVWDLQTASPIAVLTGHTGMITSVNFCPSPRTDLKYLVTTSTDGSIAFWQYSTPRGQKITFAPKPTQYHEKLRPGQAQMLCATFSPGGMFLAAGSADHHVRVYLMADDGPKRILESEAYTDAVDSVQWAHRGLRFISGSKDGTAHIWTFESQQWKNVKLSMSERLPSCPEPEEGKKLKVTMVAWDCSDDYVITAANDFTIKIWRSKTANLHCVLRGHTDELYVLESNPKDKHVLLSAGHDGKVFLWDIERGVSIASFINDIDGQGHGGVFDAKWSPDGTMIAATDSHGHLLIFGLGYGPEKYQILPMDLFFHTDYRPLVRDASHHVVDEQTQVMPHLMPPPFLVDAYGSPHPAHFQRYVPGRENCSSEQLLPNVTIDQDGGGLDENAPQNVGGNFLHIDRLIAALANRQGVSGGGPAADAQNAANVENLPIEIRNDALVQLRHAQELNRGGNVLGRNAGQINARRPSEANSLSSIPRPGASWGRPPTEQQQQQPPTHIKYIRRVYVRPMKYAQLQNLKQFVYGAGQYEMQEYKREMRRRPIMISTSNVGSILQPNPGRPRSTRANGISNGNVTSAARPGRRRGQGNQARPVYRTRAVRDAEQSPEPAPPEEDDEEESSATSGDTSYSNAEENLDESSDDSDTESSDYSDWVADTPGPNLEPPQRSKRKPLDRAPANSAPMRRSITDDSSDDEQATTSAAAAAKVRRRRQKRIVIPPRLPRGTEIPELYRPPEWLSEVIPRKAPYYPQMGDEIVYFRQGHHRYLEAVRQKKVYKLTHSSEPWSFRTLRDRELVRVIGIKYEIRPPRLCCLKLAMIDEDGNMTGSNFKIKYHDMPDVLDFLVLRQTFDLAEQRNWSVGDRFRCMIGDGWWMGQIESRHSLSSDFPDSYFMCFRVRWDNGEYEYMSPWDMEPIDENRLPDEVGGAVPVLAEEIRATLYQPKSEEWHRGDRDGSCRRIINGLEQLMNLSFAEPFLAPVDLTEYPDYAYAIEYPIDLSTIKARFENHFYRRITSAQFDVRYLATNAEKYNQRHSYIVRQARIITDLCLRIIRESNDIDVAAVYHQLVDVYHSTEGDDSDSIVPSTTSTGPTTSSVAHQNQRASSTRRSNRARSDVDWRTDCRQLLDLMWQRPDSEPFREPVDTIEFPDYLEIIATPMDLRTVKEDLLGGNYEDPLDFAKDVRLIFQNSKNYNTNKRSRIYAMTLRLSALFESQIKTVINNWKAARRRANKAKAQCRSGGSGTPSSPNKSRTPVKPKTRGNQPQRTTRRLLISDGSDDDESSAEDQPGPSQKRNAVRNGVVRDAVVASTSGSNRVTSSSQSTRRRPAVESSRPAQRSSARRRAASQEEDEEEEEEEDDEAEGEGEAEATDDEEEEEANATSSSEDEDTTDSDNDDDATTPDDDDDDNDGRHKRKMSARKRHQSSADYVDSEESYKPEKGRGRRRGGKQSNKHRNSEKNQTRSARSIKRKRRYNHDDNDDDSTHETKRKRRNGRDGRDGSNSKPTPTKSEKNTGNRGYRRGNGQSEEDVHAGAISSQIDESTQDSVSHTPRKRGRPTRNNTENNDGSSTSAAALRSTRNQQQSNTTSNGGRRPATENDHSYHLPVRNGRIAESDTDSREVAARPTRASVKRAIMNWARLSDVEDASEEAEEILPTPTPTKANNATSSTPIKRELNGSSTSRAAATSVSNNSSSAMRQLRTNRNTVVEQQEDSDADSDNEPLASSQASTSRQNQRTQSNYVSSRQATSSETSLAPHPTHLLRTRPPVATVITSTSTANTHMTRSHATSTTSNVATSTLSERTEPLTNHDHNYLGASTSAAAAAATSQRSLRRVLSRHQRNADELDTVDFLEQTVLPRFRRGAVPTSTTASLTQSATSASEARTSVSNSRNGNFEPRRGRSRLNPEASQPETNEDEDDDENNSGASDVGTDGGSRTQSGHVTESADSDDNQPLTSFVTTAATRTARTREDNREAANRQRRQSRRNLSEDSSFVCEDDDDDYKVTNAAHSRRRQQQSRTRKGRSQRYDDDSSAGADDYENRRKRTQRGSRNQKRPRYNELSEEEPSRDEYSENRNRRKRGENPHITEDEDDTAAPSKQQPTQVSNDESDDDDEKLVSVSSRGRVRKITAKARKYLKE